MTNLPLPVATLPFGKYKDKPLGEVPSDYLDWLTRNCKLSSGLHAAVAEELSRRGLSTPQPPAAKPVPPCDRCGDAGYICKWQTLRNGERRIRAECRRCGGLLKHVAMTAENIALANENG